MPSISYAPSEAAIERRIGRAGFFQRVAEQLACGIYVDLANNLVPFGRRTDDKTSAGWPDAFLTKADGALIAIEATTAGNARTGHWHDDIAKLETRLATERRGGLIWVAWCDASTPNDAAEMRDQACRLGLPGADVHIVFRKDLCARLRKPFHARFWINDLDLRVTSEPFGRVEDVIARFNMRRSTSIFPSADEYQKNRVHIPPVLSHVEKVLIEQRAALVVGHGAAGKTTLAIALAHRPHFQHGPTYYLDLTASAPDATLAERAGHVIVAVADRGVLFVIDNAHLDPALAVRVFEHWKAFGRESHLLILTRRIRAKVEAWDHGPDLEFLPLARPNLVVEPADLEGVDRRLHWARRKIDAPSVQAEIVVGWHRLFGGDLLSFSAAVFGLLDRDGEAVTLGPADARAYIRERYLDHRDLAAERLALLDLAAVGELEGLVPVEAFAREALRNCVRHGLVWIETLGSDRTYDLYRLAHPGLGTLLRDAADQAGTSRDARSRLLQDHPFPCVVLATTLRKNGEDAEAKALLAALWCNAEWPLHSNGLQWWPSAVRVAQELQVLTAKDLLTRVRSWLSQPVARAGLIDQVLATPVGYLQSFLSYVQTEMPDIAKIVRNGLVASPDALVKRVLATQLNYVPPFLTYVSANMPDVAKAVCEGLERNSDALIEEVLAMPLGELPAFLSYLSTAMPDVAKAAREGLERNSDALIKRALTTPCA